MNVQDIVARLRKASDSYYNTGESIMTDAEFDELRDKLAELDPTHPFLKTVGAPIKTSVWPKRKHATLMGSQHKVNTKEEFEQWARKTNKGRMAVSLKLDGSTIVLSYTDGKLSHATTRGDGEEGEVITQNVLRMGNVKEDLPIPFTGDLRGEIMLSSQNFKKYFEPVGYKNPRNSANGKARDVKNKDGLVKHLEVIYFDVIPSSYLSHLSTEQTKHKLVESMGLVYVDTVYLEYDKVWGFFEKFDRNKLAYQIDGLICRVDDLEEQTSLGVTSKRPNGQVAIKFESPRATTILNDVTWQVGLSGRITPVAELEPVALDGVTIKRATLNNLDYIEELGLEIGDTVLISRRNDVIPAIEEVVKKSNSGKGVNQPTVCPTCENTLDRDGAYIICPFTECAGAVFGDLMTWIKIQKMLGFGFKIVSDLIDADITTPDALYTTSVKQLGEAVGSDKIAAKLRAEIEKSREMTLDKFLAGLNIPHLGKTNSKRLTKRFGTLDAVLKATADDFATVEGIKTTAKKIRSGLTGKDEQMKKLLEHVTIVEVAGKLAGKSFAMTGLRNINGHDIGDLITQNGGDTKSGVSKGLDYLIIKDPESTSNKAEKARKYGTKLISPAEFMEMIS